MLTDVFQENAIPHTVQRCLVLACLGLITLGASPVLAEGRKARMVKFDAINERWEGAECVLRIPLEFKKKKPNKGWYKSRIYLTGDAVGIKTLQFRLRVTDLAPLQSQMASGHLVSGTRFICEGWKLRDEDAGDGGYLALRTIDGSADAEFIFWAGVGHPELKEVESVEQWVRLNLMDVRAKDETLTRVALDQPAPARPAPARSSSVPAPTSTANTTAERQVFRPELELLAVSVKPAEVQRGGSIELVTHYSVAGLPQGAAFEVTETRRLLRGELVLTERSEVVARTNGAFTSSQSAPVPADTEPGLYRLEVVVELAGAEASGRALFEVR